MSRMGPSIQFVGGPDLHLCIRVGSLLVQGQNVGEISTSSQSGSQE
jgi:hypothetical protein